MAIACAISCSIQRRNAPSNTGSESGSSRANASRTGRKPAKGFGSSARNSGLDVPPETLHPGFRDPSHQGPPHIPDPNVQLLRTSRRVPSSTSTSASSGVNQGSSGSGGRVERQHKCPYFLDAEPASARDPTRRHSPIRDPWQRCLEDRGRWIAALDRARDRRFRDAECSQASIRIVGRCRVSRSVHRGHHDAPKRERAPSRRRPERVSRPRGHQVPPTYGSALYPGTIAHRPRGRVRSDRGRRALCHASDRPRPDPLGCPDAPVGAEVGGPLCTRRRGLWEALDGRHR